VVGNPENDVIVKQLRGTVLMLGSKMYWQVAQHPIC